jgi:hypothetical protein
MARPERVELPTFWFVARRSIQLSYGRVIASTLSSSSYDHKLFGRSWSIWSICINFGFFSRRIEAVAYALGLLQPVLRAVIHLPLLCLGLGETNAHPPRLSLTRDNKIESSSTKSVAGRGENMTALEFRAVNCPPNVDVLTPTSPP